MSNVKLAVARAACIISVLLLFPSVVPGAMSILAYLISLIAVCITYFTKEQSRNCFILSSAVVSLGALTINDSLRVIANESIVTANIAIYYLPLVAIISLGLYTLKK